MERREKKEGRKRKKAVNEGKGQGRRSQQGSPSSSSRTSQGDCRDRPSYYRSGLEQTF